MTRDMRRGIVGIIAVLYGIGIAFGPMLIDNEGLWNAWLGIGAFVVGAAWLALMVLPWTQERAGRSSA